MPLYHTMGVRSLLAMALVGGFFVCVRRLERGAALECIAKRERHVTSISCRRSITICCADRAFAAHGRVVGQEARLRRRADERRAAASASSAAFEPELFVNHYGSSEVYTFTIDQDATAKPGSGGPRGHQQDGSAS